MIASENRCPLFRIMRQINPTTEIAMSEVIIVIAILLVLAIGVILILAATKPSSFSVRRTAAVNAPAERIFAVISDFREWRGWSPWENRDPGMKRTYDGSERGKGAVYAWDGNKNVGAGRMEILEATTPSKILIKLDFIKPFEGHNTAEFTMSPQGNATNVNWVMQGPASFMSKVMQVFVSFDKMIGKDFEAGLANLKKLVEK
jgi:uncharacterized protein YndB with AHSA1/START domain